MINKDQLPKGFFDHKPPTSAEGGHPSVDVMKRIADELIEQLKLHEDEEHDGKTCMTERVSVTAYIGHCLGLTAEHDDAMAHFLGLYDKAHEGQSQKRSGDARR